jgi:riboflavin synthase alpha subunit
MFTGIVPCTGRILKMATTTGPSLLWLTSQGDLAGEARPPRQGDSIAVSGVCLTIAEIGQDGALAFDVVPETLRQTKLGDLHTDDIVNLEPAVAPTQPLGGHFMQGHVDGLGHVTEFAEQGGEHRLMVNAPSELADYLTPKGSIAIDGVSLTLATVDGCRFEIALIPTTLELTSLGQLQAGDRVNLETDIIARTTVDWLRTHFGQATADAGAGGARPSSTVTRQLLEQAGFDESS